MGRLQTKNVKKTVLLAGALFLAGCGMSQEKTFSGEIVQGEFFGETGNADEYIYENSEDNIKITFESEEAKTWINGTEYPYSIESYPPNAFEEYPYIIIRDLNGDGTEDIFISSEGYRAVIMQDVYLMLDNGEYTELGDIEETLPNDFVYEYADFYKINVYDSQLNLLETRKINNKDTRKYLNAEGVYNKLGFLNEDKKDYSEWIFSRPTEKKVATVDGKYVIYVNTDICIDNRDTLIEDPKEYIYYITDDYAALQSSLGFPKVF